MIDKMLEQRIQEYNPKNELEQENVLQEIMQSLILAGLSKHQFFTYAGFHGGTCLKFFFGLQRFSEDLDFILKKTNPNFDLKPYLKHTQEDLEKQGISCEIKDKSRSDVMVKKAFLKTNSIGHQLSIDLPFQRYKTRKIKVKLEVDSNPPKDSTFETHFMSFPLTTPVTTQTLETSFAGKSHALLCRVYVKGRDWYDLIWYVNKNIIPNMSFLQSALNQQGPWAKQNIKITPQWYTDALLKKVKEIDWASAKDDVKRFLPTQEQDSLKHWDKDFFTYHIRKLREYL